MKTKVLFLALVAVAAMSTWAQAPIVNFPQELGTAEYGKVAEVPKEFKDATSVLYKTEVDGNIIAEYIGQYGYPYLCSFDADMNMYFPPKDWQKVKNRFIGVNEANQVIAIRDAKKGAEIGLFDKQMNLIKSIPISADAYNDKSIANMFVEDGRVYLIIWQYNKKPHCWMGYTLDAKSLDVLSQIELGTSWNSQFIYSDNKEYIGCIAIDENKGKHLRHPLYNGTEIKLLDKNFNILQERYVYGNIDDPWVWAQDEKTRKKIYNGGMTGILTNGDYHIQINNDGVLKYITLDAASAHIITVSSNEVKLIRDNRLSMYTLSANRNDSTSITDVMTDRIFMKQTLINADDNNIILQAWYKTSQLQIASVGYVSINWNLKTNELVSLKDEKKIFPAEGADDSKNIIYEDEKGVLVEHIRGKEKGTMYYDMWCSRDGKEIQFPCFSGSTSNDNYMELNSMYYLAPIKSRSLIAHSNATDVYCFLVHESLNSGFNATAPIETTKPLYLEFISKKEKLAEYIFPETTYETISFGLLGGTRRSYRSLLMVNASSIDENSIRLYIKSGSRHQWVVLHPNLFDANYKAAHPEKF